jgi:glycerol uptake facilitator-like aquaporin
VRKISTVTGLLFIVVEMLGAWAAYGTYTYFVNSSLQPVGGHFTGRILVAEAVGAAIFALGWVSAIYQGYTRAATAAVAGLSLMIGILAASSASIGLLNPAVAFGVRAWVWGTYVLGPIVGAIIGINLYHWLLAESAPFFGARTPAAAISSDTANRGTAKKPAKKPARRKK